jgi:hypothetical protein
MTYFGQEARGTDLADGGDCENVSAFPVANEASYAFYREAYNLDSHTDSQDHSTKWTLLYADSQFPNLLSNRLPSNHSHSVAPVGLDRSTCVLPEQVDLQTDLIANFWQSTDSSFGFLDVLDPNYQEYVHIPSLGLITPHLLPCSSSQ